MIPAWRLGFDPLIGWVWILALGLLMAALLAIFVVRGGRGGWVRAAGLGLVLAALANPQSVQETREPAQDVAAVLIDQSESMVLAGRAEAAQRAGRELARRLAEEHGIEVRVREVRGGPDGTAIVAALEDVLADVPTDRAAGAILVTEGQAADPPAAPDRFRRYGPTHTLVVGDPDRGDRRITLLSAPPVGIVGEQITIRAQVDGPGGDGRVPVRVSVDGVTVGEFPLRVGRPSALEITVPKRGRSMVILEVPPGPEEITTANNRAAFELQGVRDRLRVLLVTGEPYPGARVWRNLLKSDASVDLVHFTILRPPDKQDDTDLSELSLITFPTYELFVEKLDRFDLIIFDRYRYSDTLEPQYFDNIARRVEDGGALLIAAGPFDAEPASVFRTPVAAILPGQPTGRVLRTPYRPTLTEIGRRHPVLRALPNPERWGRWSQTVEVNAPGGETVMTGADGKPLLVLSRAGQGRVALLMSDQAWLWARGHDGGGPYGELLRRLSHWLMQEPDLEEDRLTLTPTPQGLALERTTLGAAPEPATVIDPAGQSAPAPLAEAAPGLYRGSAPAPIPGLYEARSGAARAFAAVGPLNPKEASALNATGDILEPLSDATGAGVVLAGEDGANLPELRRVARETRATGSGWIGFARNEAYVVRAATARPLLPGWAWALAALAAFMLAWRREAR